jgi:transposase
LGERIGVSDDEWALIGPLLPAERGRGCRPAGDNRPYFEGMMWMARTGAQWRQLPDEYGKWNSVFRRYRRWVVTGVFEAMLETLAAVVERDTTADMIDSTIVRAHHCAVGLKKGIRRPRGLAVREAASRLSCPLRWSGPTAVLHPDAGTGSRREGLWTVVRDAGRPDRGAARRQRL